MRHLGNAEQRFVESIALRLGPVARREVVRQEPVRLCQAHLPPQ